MQDIQNFPQELDQCMYLLSVWWIGKLMREWKESVTSILHFYIIVLQYNKS